MNFYLVLTLYYIAVIVSVLFHRYFSRFIESDFNNNRTLKIKRRWGIAYFYIMGFFSVYFIHFIGDTDLGWLNDHVLIAFIIGSIFVIILLYAHIIVSLESPKKFHKKRKWK